MAENKMAEVAAVFGKKLNEPFKVKYLGDIHTAEFTGGGLKQSDYFIGFDMLHVLATGKAVIVDE